MYGVGISEKVVHIAKNLLISSYEKDTEIVGFGFLQGMNGQHMRDVSIGDEVGNLAVTVAGDVLKGGIAGGTFIESLDGNDRKELIDGPTIGQRLEEREVAKILVGQEFVHVTKLFGHVFETFR